MKKHFLICLLLSMAFLLPACSRQIPAPNKAAELPETESISENPSENEEHPKQPELPVEPEPALSEPAPQAETLALSINGTVLDVQWEENETVAELLAYVQNQSITVNTTIYGGFEQVGSLPQAFSRNDIQMTTEPGDIVLCSGNQLVLFFGSNTWSYTKLGHIEGISADELSELLSGDSAVIEIELN